ncbi:MAG: hypothetical protein KR126chlam6_00608 [Candidatus Anoxychlamydiales bacterium]|nr:hypothetical protein [Candidatus Anoxychlamydiales bacterium]
MNSVIALFGESEKGRYCYPYYFSNVIELAETLGNAPDDSLGIELAIQALMYERDIIYFRVEEEGNSLEQYMRSIEILKDKNRVKKINAICIPKVGDSEIITNLDMICKMHKSIIIMSEKDLFDYLISI